ncbi:hypothetical protein [Bacillus bingmayongensis]|uniref:hypothetical protein n=1 Tax=Bacillus bingmayongensis TaxID=1150157 RepID=UPI0002E008B0|nr:hypothetical protein [Bacillus bingmayongensis]MBY0599326.1 hypothetical protein [Bacillus bingmayongensis]
MRKVISWNEVMEKQHVVGITLQNALLHQQISHAYLFGGAKSTLKGRQQSYFIKLSFVK